MSIIVNIFLMAAFSSIKSSLDSVVVISSKMIVRTAFATFLFTAAVLSGIYLIVSLQIKR